MSKRLKVFFQNPNGVLRDMSAEETKENKIQKEADKAIKEKVKVTKI